MRHFKPIQIFNPLEFIGSFERALGETRFKREEGSCSLNNSVGRIIYSGAAQMQRCTLVEFPHLATLKARQALHVLWDPHKRLVHILAWLDMFFT